MNLRITWLLDYKGKVGTGKGPRTQVPAEEPGFPFRATKPSIGVYSTECSHQEHFIVIRVGAIFGDCDLSAPQTH